MTCDEFSNEFDTLVNSYSTTNSFGKTSGTLEFDEYEKSVFLTKAQEEVVVSLYNGKNPFGDSFEKTEETRRYLNELVKNYSTSTKKSVTGGVDEKSVFFDLPVDLMFITYESVDLKDDSLGCHSNKNIQVIPVTQDEYHRLKKNPFRGKSYNRALRLDLGNNIVEIVSDYNIETYKIRYIRKPTPIVLVDLPSDVSIDDETRTKTECELNPVLHRTILERAVTLALRSRSIGK